MKAAVSDSPNHIPSKISVFIKIIRKQTGTMIIYDTIHYYPNPASVSKDRVQHPNTRLF
jgi:hypothetical protein